MAATGSREDHPEVKEQPLSSTSNSEMGARETWNERNPPLEAVVVRSLKALELLPRPHRKTKAMFFRLGGGRRLQAHMSELPPLGSSVKHRHTTEAIIYIVAGRGYTTLSWDDGDEQRIDWEEGDLFSFPVWMWHQHWNLSDTEPARYLAIQDTFTIKSLGLHNIERHPDS